MTEMTTSFELYLHDSVIGYRGPVCISGHELKKHIKETGLIDRCFSLEDELVQGWIANPSTYPEELRKQAVCLWKSVRISGGYRSVPCIVYVPGRWNGEGVGNGNEWIVAHLNIHFHQLDVMFSSFHPALLRC